MSYRPITDTWILARPKVKYYGAYPSGFLERARALLGVTIDDSVLHVCSGMVKGYPFRGRGINDMTVDLNRDLNPDFVADVRKEIPAQKNGWKAILCDPPYTEDDAEHYNARQVFPKSGKLVADCIKAVRVGGRVGILHYEWPRPPVNARSVAVVGVLVGFSNRIRCYSVFERIT